VRQGAVVVHVEVLGGGEGRGGKGVEVGREGGRGEGGREGGREGVVSGDACARGLRDIWDTCCR
jgi:hypothetical protein